MRPIEFTVHGTPAPKGSMKAFVRPGAKFATVTHDNKNTKPWSAAVQAAAYAAYHTEGSPRPLISSPISIEIAFSFTRPKSHRRTGRNSHLLRDSAPKGHITKPDVDKLTRAILDALTGIVYRDDSQVVNLTASKQYTDGSEGASITIYQIGETV